MTDNLGRHDVDSIYKNLLFITEELLISLQRKDIPFAGLKTHKAWKEGSLHDISRWAPSTRG